MSTTMVASDRCIKNLNSWLVGFDPRHRTKLFPQRGRLRYRSAAVLWGH